MCSDAQVGHPRGRGGLVAAAAVVAEGHAVVAEGHAVVGEADAVDDAFGATHVTCVLKPAAGPNGVTQVPDAPSWSGVPGTPLQSGEL